MFKLIGKKLFTTLRSTILIIENYIAIPIIISLGYKETTGVSKMHNKRTFFIETGK